MRHRLAVLAAALGVLLTTPVLDVAGSWAEADGTEGVPPSSVLHFELDFPAQSLVLSGRFAYVACTGFGGWPVSRFEVFDVSEQARVASIWAGFPRCVAVGGEFAYLGGWEFRIVDVSEPTAPQTVATYPTPDDTWDIAVDKTYAYLADTAGLHIFDVSDPTSPTPVGSVAIPKPAWSVAVKGRYAYLGTDAAELVVVDVSHPSSPSVVGSCVLPGPAWDVAIRGSRVYVADGTGLEVIDVSRPAKPRLIGSAETPGDARRVAIHGARAYVVDWETTYGAYDGDLQIIDIANPRSPTVVNSIRDVPILEDYCTVRLAEAACIGVDSGRIVVAGRIVHALANNCDCGAGLFGCDYFTGYLDVTLASSYQAVSPDSNPEARTSGSPDGFALRGNEPNPFNAETLIRFDVPRSSRVRIEIYDVLGRLVRTLVDDTLPPGPHEVSWRGRRESGEAVASGIYFVMMEAGDVRRTMKITMVK